MFGTQLRVWVPGGGWTTLGCGETKGSTSRSPLSRFGARCLRCLVGKAIGVPPGPNECGVLLQGCPGATFLLKEGHRRCDRYRLKKSARRESCKLSFIWGKMRTVARETAFQIALRNCSKEVGGKVSIYVILVKGEYMQ